MIGSAWLSATRFVVTALVSYELSFGYQWDNHFWSVVYGLLTLQSFPHERLPFTQALMIASDRIVGTVLGCCVGLASYVFLSTIIIEDYFFWLVDATIIMNVFLGAYLAASSRHLQIAGVCSTLILSMSFVSEDITQIVLIYIYETMMAVTVACSVYMLTLPLFYWQARAQRRTALRAPSGAPHRHTPQ